MLPRVIAILLATAVSSCGAKDDPSNQSIGAPAGSGITRASVDLISDAFQEGRAVPARYTCDGANEAPPVHWTDPPPETRSFALILDDPDAPGGTFRHWGVYDIPLSVRSIGNGQRIGRELTNDFGKRGYGGPCPPRGHGAHHYYLKLFALSVDRLNLNGGSTIAELEHAASGHAIAQGKLVAVYGRK